MTKLEEFQKNEKVQQTKRFSIKNIRAICCVGMIVFLFVGNLVEYSIEGIIDFSDGITGYNAAFNSNIWNLVISSSSIVVRFELH